jgi:ribosomal protein S18 acetylase RimI-like enzyme
VGRLRVRPATDDDVGVLVDGMRACDRAEVLATSGPDLHQAVRRALAATPDPLAVEADGVLLVLGGVAPISVLDGEASPWALATDAFRPHAGRLTRLARAYLARMDGAYPHLSNFVHARNATSVRWLRRLGFTIHPAAPYGHAGELFHRFTRG